ncbi:MAG: UDP-N-acetylglucosamine 2-epimerase (non-hydrolyzing) [Pseudomonadales bacterium]|nr:UDP-N-acetylglucosamine 2-epimerase (non-hydrolyzing) [Pseudomonadales bacterium]
MPIKVMTIVGTRPEIIKLCRVIHELDTHTNHILVHSGQNYDYELNEIFFEQLNIRKPDYFLEAAGTTVAWTIGNIIGRADEVMEREEPDAVLLLGDTNSCLSVIAAKRRKIPIFHMEAGNRCFDQRVPEEINRKLVDHISDINMTYTEHARRYLISEGVRPETLIKTGSPMKEVLDHYRLEIENSTVLSNFGLEAGSYFVVSAHREENVDSEENFAHLLESLNQIAVKYDQSIIFSTHPRTRKKLEEYGEEKLDQRIRLLKPLGFFDYVNLQINATCTISDSGTIFEESSILNFPAVTIRQTQERPEGMDEGSVIMCGLRAETILDSIEVAIAHAKQTERRFKIVDDYDVDNVSKKVLRIILSYKDYVNRTVWSRSTNE